MVFSINTLLESLSNPEGRFKTLAGIALRSCARTFTATTSQVSFPVTYQHRPYTLKCLLNSSAAEGDTSAAGARLRQVAAQIQAKSDPHWVSYHYYGEEMLVFDDSGQARYVDILLMESPAGSTLAGSLTAACQRRDKRTLTQLLRNFCTLGIDLLGSDLVHGRLRPDNLLVCADNTLRLINYESMVLHRVCAPESAASTQDALPVAHIALWLKLLSDDPTLLHLLTDSGARLVGRLPAKLLSHILHRAQRASCAPMAALASALLDTSTDLDIRTFIDHLAELSVDTHPVLLESPLPDYFTAPTTDTTPTSTSSPAATTPSDPTAPPIHLTQYDTHGPLSEGLYSVSTDDRWGYISHDGCEVIPLIYDWGDDFREGRALVMQAGLYGVIDKEGREVLPLVYEVSEWSCDKNLMTVSLDGKFGLFNRAGQMILPPTYDWMGEISSREGMILVRHEGLFGYIGTDGKVRIALQYADAFSFREDRALVSLNGRDYVAINIQGETLTAPQ